MTTKKTTAPTEQTPDNTPEKAIPAMERPVEEGPVNYEEAIEAILFAAGHPVTYEKLADTFGMTESLLKERVQNYAKKYNGTSLPRGVMMILYDDACQLCTKEHYISYIRYALGIRKSGTLSTSSIEALAIIAYHQPVTRAYVDAVRGVDSSYAVTNLLERELIEIRGRLDAPGRPMLYGTSENFLRCFGLNSLAELPGMGEEIGRVFSAIEQKMALEEGGPEQLTLQEQIDEAAEGTEDGAPVLRPAAPPLEGGETPAENEEEATDAEAGVSPAREEVEDGYEPDEDPVDAYYEPDTGTVEEVGDEGEEVPESLD